MEKHFVTFYAPGTLICETLTLPVDSWNVEKATKMADSVILRHSATPFAFEFITKGREDDELDSRVISKSPTYYLGGKIATLKELEARNSPDEAVLRANMRRNKWDRVIINTNSWSITNVLSEDDVVLDYTPPHKR
jgi:hypothetical protein